MIIRVFANSDCYPLYDTIMNIEYLKKYTKEPITFTKGEDYTHAILINTCMPTLTIPKKNVVGLAYEPIPFLGLTEQYIEYAKQNIGKYYVGDKGDLPAPFVEQYSYNLHNKAPRPETYVIPLKTNFCSIIISNKMYAPGHIYRHILVQNILNSNLPIDIYGCGCPLYTNFNDNRIKGAFESGSLEPYEKYSYHICIENYKSNHYLSEKIINPLLTSTVPIYIGCNNIETYFPKNVLYLTGIPMRDMRLLYSIFRNHFKYHKEIDIKKVVEVTDIFNNIDKIFDIL